MTQSQRQKMFLETIRLLKKSYAFAEAMDREQINRGTALTLFQLTGECHDMSFKLLDTMGGDTTPKII